MVGFLFLEKNLGLPVFAQFPESRWGFIGFRSLQADQAICLPFRALSLDLAVIGLSNYNQFASLIHRLPSEGFESKAASSDGKTESDSGTVIGPFGISLFLAEWDEPQRARGDRRQSLPDELPRIHEACAPLPPKDWRRYRSGTVPMSGLL